MMAIVTPLVEFDLWAPLWERVVATDASSTGHGLAYAAVPEAERIVWAKEAEFRGEYTAWWQNPDLDPGEQDKPLGLVVKDRASGAAVRRLRVPRRAAAIATDQFSWSCVAKPSGPAHITVEEARATVWGFEHSVRSPGALGRRILLLGDNSVSICALSKGRSASRQLNREVRHLAAGSFLRQGRLQL